MTTKKEWFLCFVFAIAINLALIYLYGRFIKPEIDGAAKGMAIMILNHH
jgi:hypothetical protein